MKNATKAVKTVKATTLKAVDFKPAHITTLARTAALSVAFIAGGKLSFAGKHFADSARDKHDQIVNTLADTVKLDKTEALNLITATLDRMDGEGVKGEPRRIIKVSLQRAITFIHSGAVKVSISERPERKVTMTDIAEPANWVEAEKATLKRLAAIMEKHSLTFYDIASGVEMVAPSEGVKVAETVTNKNVEKARLAREDKDYGASVLAEVVNG